MKLFRRYEQCYGLSLPAIGRWKVELWFCAPQYRIQEHCHLGEDIKLIFLWGKSVMFYKHRKEYVSSESYLANFPSDLFKCFNIWAGEFHSFEVSTSWLVFLNIEHWKKGVKITSASEDLQLTKQKEFDYASSI